MPRSPRHYTSPQDIPGYRLLPGTARRYQRVSDGTVISRRDYLDKQARARGWSDAAQYQAISKIAGGLGGMGAPASQIALGTLNNAGIDEHERRGAARDYQAELRSLARDPTNKAHNGPLAKWLEAIGLREQNAPYDVGDTPSTK